MHLDEYIITFMEKQSGNYSPDRIFGMKSKSHFTFFILPGAK